MGRVLPVGAGRRAGRLRGTVPRERGEVPARGPGTTRIAPEAGLGVGRPRARVYLPRKGGSLEAVEIITQPTFAFGRAVTIPRKFYPGAPAVRALYDIMPDGRFVGVVPVGDSSLINSAPQIDVVLNWLEELKRLVPPELITRQRQKIPDEVLVQSRSSSLFLILHRAVDTPVSGHSRCEGPVPPGA